MSKKKKNKIKHRPAHSAAHGQPLPAEFQDNLKELEQILTQEVQIPGNDFQPPDHSAGGEKKDSTILADIIKKTRQKRLRAYIYGGVLGLIILAGAALTGYIYFSRNNAVAEEHVELKIKGPEKVVVGQEVTYSISYANTGQIDLKNAKLIFREPHGFEITGTYPETAGRSWDLADLLTGQRGRVDITGRLIDNPEVAQEFNATLIFEPINFNSEFTVQTNLKVSLLPPDLSLDLYAPQTITPGEKMTINIKLTNNNLETVDNFIANIAYPAQFSATQTEPAAEQDKNQWRVTQLQPAAAQEIKISGQFPAEIKFDNNDQRNQEFILQIMYPNRDGQFFLQLEKKFAVKIVDQALVPYMIINGSSDNQSINLQDTLNFSVIYKNKGDQDYSNLKVSAVINSSPDQILDWDKIDDPEFGAIEKTAAGRTITWTKTQIPELETVAAGQEGMIDFKIPVKAFEQIDDASLNALGGNVIETYTSLILTDDSGTLLPAIDSAKITLNLNSNVSLTNKALFFFEDGTPIGAGPLPPVVGEKTTYVIFWEIANDLHELENIEIKTTLPEQITWLDKNIISAGEVKFDEINRELKWQLNRLPVSAKQASLTFHLELTPTAEHQGKLMKLLNNTILTATDTVTKEVITITDGVLTTNLDQDEFGAGKGIITAADAAEFDY